jgi:hypothetical protein
MTNRDKKIIVGELRLKAGSALIIFLLFSLIVASVTGIIMVLGNPSPGIINRAYLAILIVLILDVIIFRKTFMLVIDLVRLQKVIVNYDGIHMKFDKSEVINESDILAKLSKSGNFEKLDFNHSFRVELSKSNKEILYVEQFGKVIFPVECRVS